MAGRSLAISPSVIQIDRGPGGPGIYPRVFMSIRFLRVVGFLFYAGLLFSSLVHADDTVLLNASFDPTRALFREYNGAFAKWWLAQTGENVVIRQSHGGSGKQARAILEGLPADVTSLALAYDVDVLHRKGNRLQANWESRFPAHSVPFHSVVVFLVRKSHAKEIRDWSDLLKPGITVVTPNPKTSGGARWNYLAAWAYADRRFAGDTAKIRAFMKDLYSRVPVLDAGARGSSITFVQRGIGDVLITWESEAWQAIQENEGNDFVIVHPSVSIKAETPVAVVDAVVEKKGTRREAEAYVAWMYSPVAQRIIAKHGFRPLDPTVSREFRDRYPELKLLTIRDLGKDWGAVQKKHFADGGEFDAIYGL